MESKFLQNESRAVRLQALKDNAEKTEQFTYPKMLGEQDLAYLKDEAVKDYVKLAKLEEERKEWLASHKGKVKPIKQNVAASLNKIRARVEEVQEEVFLLADQEEGMMGYYNAEGILVHQRMLLPEERQFRIVDQSNTKTAN